MKMSTIISQETAKKTRTKAKKDYRAVQGLGPQQNILHEPPGLLTIQTWVRAGRRPRGGG